jgi:hypothetical protein
MTSQINSKALKLRHEYMSCIKLADETDSKKEDKVLREDAKSILETLKKSCKHQYVIITQDEYYDCYEAYNERYYNEERICLCCSLSDDSQKKGPLFLAKIKPIARYFKKDLNYPLKLLLQDILDMVVKHGYNVSLPNDS